MQILLCKVVALFIHHIEKLGFGHPSSRYYLVAYKREHSDAATERYRAYLKENEKKLNLSTFEEDAYEKDEKKASFRWLILCGISAAASGFTGVCQKIHQSDALGVKAEMGALLLSAFAVSAIFFAVMTLVHESKRKREAKKVTDKAPIPTSRFGLVSGMAVLCGAVFAFLHTINLGLAGRLPAIIMFPLVNLGPMIVIMVTGIFLFRERLSVRRWIGMGVGIASIVLLSGVIG